MVGLVGNGGLDIGVLGISSSPGVAAPASTAGAKTKTAC